MITRARITATMLGLMAPVGTAQGFTPERAGLFVDALRDNGCAMTTEEAPVLLPPLGLAPDEVQQFVDLLFLADLVTLSDDMAVLSLTDPLCVADAEAQQAMIEAAYDVPEAVLEPWIPAFSPDEGAALIGAVRDNGCAMSDAEAGVILAQAGMSPTLTRDIAAVLLEFGLASVGEDAQSFVLSDALCAADAAEDAATAEAARAAFVATLPMDQQPGADDAPAPADGGE